MDFAKILVSLCCMSRNLTEEKRERWNCYLEKLQKPFVRRAYCRFPKRQHCGIKSMNCCRGPIA